MKIRTGFVSNSSSSSFVVAFPHKPESIEDLKKMMFGKQEWHYAGIHEIDNTNDASTQQIAENVFTNIKEEATVEQIFESIRNGWFDSYLIPDLLPGYYDVWNKIKNFSYEKDKEKINNFNRKIKKINDKRAANIVEAFRENNKDKYIIVLEYCDENGEFESMLEHSKIFNRLKYIKTSYH